MQAPIHQTYNKEQCKEAVQHDRDTLTQNTM